MSSSLRCLLAVLAVSGCAILNPPSPLKPTLAANNCQPPGAAKHNVAGMAHYKEQRFEPAMGKFQVAVEEGPTCAEAHYNLGLTLMYMGEKDEARKHFMEAANLAPGNQVIWDSPALRPYGEPQKEQKKKSTAVEKAPGGFGQRGGMGGY
ncbi:MAG: tetratricopeptide repeat protein [Nitrospirae bacterium]|nr:tetratricopeptide repeat protein [Nitrospirota bacterium]